MRKPTKKRLSLMQSFALWIDYKREQIGELTPSWLDDGLLASVRLPQLRSITNPLRMKQNVASTEVSEIPAGVAKGGEEVGTLPWYQDRRPRPPLSPFAGQDWVRASGDLPVSRFVPDRWWAQWWQTLPFPNQIVGGACALVLGMVVVSRGSLFLGVILQGALFPYTAEGKRQTCAANLQAIYQATSLYIKDSDGHLPPLDTQSQGRRMTWVSLVQPYLQPSEPQRFQCPTGPGIARDQRGIVSSYAINPILALNRLGSADDPARTLLLTDRGDRHDLSLLPPFPSWPSMAARPTASTANSTTSAGTFDAQATNLGLRHWDNQQSVANALFADGHAQAMPNGNWALEPVAWGGSFALRYCLERLSLASPANQELITCLRQADGAGASHVIAANPQAIKSVSKQLLELWMLNRGEQTSHSVNEVGWNLTRALEGAGESSPRPQLNAETSRRLEEELKAALAAGDDTMASQLGFSVQVPRTWKPLEGTEGKFRYTKFVPASDKAGTQDLFMQFVVGELGSYNPDHSFDWSEWDQALRRKYGASGYRSIRHQEILWNGHNANLWEYELEQPGSPRLHKQYVGYVSGWNSYRAMFVAPARDFERWRLTFDRARYSVVYQ